MARIPSTSPEATEPAGPPGAPPRDHPGAWRAVPDRTRTPDPVPTTARTVPSHPEGAWVIVELAPDAILLVDEHGHIVRVNRAAEVMFGYDREMLVRLGVDTLVPDRPRQADGAAHCAPPPTRPLGVARDLWARRADGSEFPAEISFSSVTSGGGAHEVVIVREVSDRRAGEQSTLELVLAEEERIAADLHDRVVRHLFAAGLGIQAILGQVNEGVAQRLVAATDELDDAIREIRKAVFRQATSSTTAVDQPR